MSQPGPDNSIPSPAPEGRWAWLWSLTPLAEQPRDFLPPELEARAFWRIRIRMLSTSIRQTFHQSRLRLALIVGLTLALWAGLFWLSLDGFQFIRAGIVNPATHDQTVRVIFGTFFAALLVMLVFSCGIILYGSLFQSSETQFLLCLPARTERVFLHKFQEAILLSSWGFLLLGSPMLIAYGIVAEAPWYYYLLLGPFMASFIYVPAALGALGCLGLIYWLPGSRVKILTTALLLFLLCVALVGWRALAGPESDLLTAAWFRQMLGRLQFTQGRLLPSWWLSSGLLEAAANNWSQSVMFLALMISNALFGRQLALALAARIYRPAYSGLWSEGRGPRQARPGPSGVDRALLWLIAPLPKSMRLLTLKDARVFRRDPVQWLQFLIFFGLLGLYFVNIRRFSYDVYYIGWVNMVSFLNLTVVGLLMSTFTTRFIFPMISLEGRRFWVLGLLPLRRDTVLWAKFFFAAGGAVAPCCALVLLSDLMLRIDLLVVVSHQLTCVMLCLGLAGIAVGLGARLPNLREESPSRIAAGFGGTLNLVVSTIYILVIVLLTAVPTHLYLTARGNRVIQIFSRELSLETWLLWWLGAGTVASVIVGLLATVIPLRIGIRAFRRLEF